jgi:hypothetical protein
MADSPMRLDLWILQLVFFFSIFLLNFIWLEDLTRKRKRGAGDEGGRPSCPAAGEDAEEDRGPAACREERAAGRG